MIMQLAIHQVVSFNNTKQIFTLTNLIITQFNLVPELEVNLIGARHLPSSFGLKTVEGYLVKVIKSHFNALNQCFMSS